MFHPACGLFFSPEMQFSVTTVLENVVRPLSD